MLLFDVVANCTFDKGTFCSWKSSQKSTFEWSIGRGETASGKQSGGMTGPMSDASGAGKMYCKLACYMLPGRS